MPAAQVEPLHSPQPRPELFLERLNRLVKRIGVLLAERVNVQPVNQIEQSARSRRKFFQANAQAGSRRTGIVDRMRLRRVLGIDPQPDRTMPHIIKELFELIERIEDDVIANLGNPIDLIRAEGGAVDVILAVKMLRRQARFVEPRRRRPRQIFFDQRIKAEHRKTFLRQQNFYPRRPLQRRQYFEVRL